VSNSRVTKYAAHRSFLAHTLVIAAFAVGVCAHAADGDADKIKNIEAQAAGWSQGVEALAATFTDDVVYEDVPLGVTNRGKEEFRKFALGFFNAFPDLKSTITSIVISGDKAAFEWLFEGTQSGDLPGIPAAGKRMSLRGMSMAEFSGGKVKHQIDYWDMATFMRQLGK
jgi:steroid delta-isomerase-like uncharacterized protein